MYYGSKVRSGGDKRHAVQLRLAPGQNGIHLLHLLIRTLGTTLKVRELIVEFVSLF